MLLTLLMELGVTPERTPWPPPREDSYLQKKSLQCDIIIIVNMVTYKYVCLDYSSVM